MMTGGSHFENMLRHFERLRRVTAVNCYPVDWDINGVRYHGDVGTGLKGRWGLL